MREDAHGTKHIPTAIPTPQFVVTGESVILKAASNSDTPMAVNRAGLKNLNKTISGVSA